MITRTKTDKSLGTLVKDLDDVFRKFIQLRDAGKPCFICGAPMSFSSEVCHYISRQHLAVRWSEIDSNMGCFECNRYDQQHAKRYRIKLIEKYGEEAVQDLEFKSRSLLKPMRSDLIELIAEYKEKLSKLK